ncbi:ATPase [uncultured Sunxiuqinia sp.]|uniref:ATPase n=1 Tax=uncultured Sunxiuqinia sp. TaxID=1573825 RepID=UPI0030DCC51C
MSILIADSGSTKTDWLFMGDSGESRSFKTSGINPFFRNSEDIYNELETELAPRLGGQPGEIFFYGAGIINQERGEVVRAALLRLFSDARVETCSDVLGASRALFGSGAGIACILGTGSNACLYDGQQVLAGIPPLGFILGDECSGAVLGKKLLGDYFKNMMPADVQTLFGEEYFPTEAEVLRRVYREERPNKYLAGFTPFLSKYIEKTYCQDMVTNSAREFFERNINQLPEAQKFALGFVGSVAWNFQPIIRSLAKAYEFKEPLILKGPIERLSKFHTTTQQ